MDGRGDPATEQGQRRSRTADAEKAESDRLRALVCEHDGIGPDDLVYMVDIVVALPPGVVADPIQRRQPKYRAAYAEAAQLDARAAALERQVVPETGEVVGHSATDLVAAVLSDPMRLGPPISDVYAWVERTETHERARRRTLSERGIEWADPEGVLTYTLRWEHGAIVEQGSSVDRPQEPPPPAEPYARVLKPSEFGPTRRVDLGEVEEAIERIGESPRARTVFIG